jgi:hypothetical protein
MTRASAQRCTRQSLFAAASFTAAWVMFAALSIHAAAPVRGLSTVPAANVSAGYLNALRSATGTTAQKIASLNYEGVDIILLAFTLLNADASLDHTYGNADVYRPYLITNAHARSRSVLMSVVGSFETVTASASLRATAATNIANALNTYGYDGVDFDWEWPDTATERANFTAFMQAVYATVKTRSSEYIVSFVQGPGYWLAGTDWPAVAPYSDFCFCIVYDWKNPANGPIRKPGSVQFLGLSGGSIEAAGKGAIDYIISHGYPENKIIAGLPFYSSDNRSWFTGAPIWATNRIGFLNSADPDYRETDFDAAWWTTPDNIKQKMSALLDERDTVLAGGKILRGIGFWEFGHEDQANPQLTTAIQEWRAGDGSLGGVDLPLPTNTLLLVDTHSTWRFLDTGVAPPAAWRSNTFNDNAWMIGTAPFGYGDGDEATVISYGTNAANKYITTWFRRAFTVANTSSVRSLTLRLLRDDGAVVYLNGAEIFRSNMPTGTVAAATLATNAVSGLEETTLFQIAAVNPSLLINGTNVLAVEVHQSSTNSSDISFEAQLLAQTEPARLVLVPPRATWRYLDAGTNLATNWTARTYDDNSWSEGRARLGYGLDGEWTTLQFGTNANAKPITSYFRHAFTVPDPGLLNFLRIALQRDDGAIIYLNGVEVLRTNMPAGPITATNLASSTISGADETNWISALLPTASLVSGLNVVAAEIHQSGTNSSDVGFDLELSAALNPRLTIVRSNAVYLLRWPATAPGFRVQQITSLNSTNWSNQSATPLIVGNSYELQVTNAPPRFYRLIAP